MLNRIPNICWWLLAAIVGSGIHPAEGQGLTRGAVKAADPVSVQALSPVAVAQTMAGAAAAAGVVPTIDETNAPPPSAEGIVRSAGGAWVRGRILVAPAAGLSDADFDAVLAGVAAQSKRKLNGLNVHVIELPAAAHGNEQAIARALSHNPHVKFAEVDEVVSVSATTNDPILPNEWHISKVGASTAWNASIGQNIVVAVIDTGVQPNHPDLVANLVPGWNVYDKNSNSSDVQGHGTAVAGTIAAVGNNGIGVVGVAYGAKVMPIRATDTAGGSTFSLIASALTWAADHGADVANISFSNLYKSSAVQAAAQYLRDRGGITVVSANNNAIDENSPNTSTMITVSATDQNDALASFSSWGSMVDLAAPGVTIQTTLWNGGYGWGTGTSFATPNVAGAVALVMAANPALAPSQVESALFTKATDLGSGGYDTRYGWGRVNAAAAVQAALGAPAADTTKPTVAIASPTGGILAGLVPVAVSASDNVGVTRVDLYAGGTLIATDNIPPYSFSWDTNKFANSGYALSAYAYDAAGNAATSAPVAVTVSNVAASTGSSLNVALSANGGVAAASSTMGIAQQPANVNDNQRSGAGLLTGGGGWADAVAGVFPDWVQINFNGQKTIDHVVVYSVQDNFLNPVEPTDTMTFTQYGLTSFSVQGWNGASWVTLGSVSGNTLIKRTVSFSPYTTDRIRVLVNAVADNLWSRITEIEAWTTSSSATTANYALAVNGGVAAASSTMGIAQHPANVNDNQRSGAGLLTGGGGWADAVAGVFPDWVQINFNGQKTIDHVVVYSVQDNFLNPVEPTDTMTFTQYGLTSFSVQGWNGASWVTLGSVSGNTLIKRTVSFSPYTTDRIRVLVNAVADNLWSRITEIEAWGN